MKILRLHSLCIPQGGGVGVGRGVGVAEDFLGVLKFFEGKRGGVKISEGRRGGC